MTTLMHALRAVLTTAAVLAAGTVAAETAATLTADQQEGQRLYASTCIHCHGASRRGNPGTYMLAHRLGEAAAVLDQRDDLAGEYIVTVVRKGLRGMPHYRKTELSDADVAAIVAYLTRSRGK